MDYHKSPPPTAPPAYGGHQTPAMGTPVPPPNNPPPSGHVHGGGSDLVPWSSGLCDCSSDLSNCCVTCWCPCITFGQIAEIVDRGSTSCGASGALYTLLEIFTGCGCIYSCFYRKKMRKQYMLAESPCGDCLVHCCCECCALCQEYRELRNRGFDMDRGWQGNVDGQNQGVTMAPIAQGGMHK
ncbi:hypothetical protein ACS0TY_008485 [Phlomoides rotata]